MTTSEHHEYMCSILAKLVDSELTTEELFDLASALGIRVAEFYDEPVSAVEIIEWNHQEAA